MSRNCGKTAAAKKWQMDYMAKMNPGDKLAILNGRGNMIITRNANQIEDKSKRPLVVIESPYAGDIHENVDYARKCMAHSLKLGEYPIASHLLYTQEGILNDDIPIERELGIYAGLAWAKHADYAVFYVDRGVSKGMMSAHELYIRESKPIEYRSLKVVLMGENITDASDFTVLEGGLIDVSVRPN